MDSRPPSPPVSAPMLPLTRSVAERLDRANVSMNLAGHRALIDIPENPRGIDIRRHGGVPCVRSRVRPDSTWDNRCYGMREENIGALPRILSYYRKYGCRPHIEVNQFHLNDTLGRALHEAGLYPHEIYPLHYSLLGKVEPPAVSSQFTVRLSPPEEIEEWVHVFNRGFGIPERAWPDIRLRRSAWYCAPGFRRYVGIAGGEIVAIAGLFIDGDTAILDPATTLPASRGLGLQRALIQLRLADASAAGCDLAGVETAWATISHRNQQRAGFDVAFNRLVFTTVPVQHREE